MKIPPHQETPSGDVLYDEGTHPSSFSSSSSSAGSHDHLGYKGRRAGKTEHMPDAKNTTYEPSSRDREFTPSTFHHHENSQADLLSPPCLPSTSSSSKRGAGGGGSSSRVHSDPSSSSLAGGGGGGGSLLGMPFAFSRPPPPPSLPSGVCTAGGTGSFQNFLGGTYHPNATGSLSSDSLHRRGGEEVFSHGIAGSIPTGRSLEMKIHQGRSSSLGSSAPSSSSFHRGNSQNSHNNTAHLHPHHSRPPPPPAPKEVCIQFPAATQSSIDTD
ncbi:hypothetical protein CSUI_009815 [Cystoisospora suis]|uniref:Uncharacterized protein n=1 Tax=Cystoisospora suis TaxID=483139 RepID=A0A2C6JF58_9APIC|nr:hypothetical protein CSUI_009815 [Cystoisospora suis]